MLSSEQFRTLCKAWVETFPPGWGATPERRIDPKSHPEHARAIGLVSGLAGSEDCIPEFTLQEFESGDCMLWCDVSIHQHIRSDMHQNMSTMYQDSSLSLDCDAIHDLSSIEWKGQVSVALHPGYQIPSLYITLHNSKGERATSEVLSQLVHDRHSATSDLSQETSGAIPERLTSYDNRTDNEVWMEEDHPITGHPVLTLHVCGVSERIDLMLRKTAQHSSSGTQPDLHAAVEENSCSFRHEESSSVWSPPLAYMLLWFALVGPSAGIRITPVLYETMRGMLEQTPR